MRLTLRTKKRCLNAVAAACLLAVPAVLIWGWSSVEPALDSATFSPLLSRAQEPTEILTGGPSISDDDPEIWAKRLRRPLYDPPPPVVVKKQPPPLRVALLGTILEPGNSMAILSGPEGKVEYKRVGDRVGPEDSPAELMEILSDSVVVRRDNASITLRLKGQE